MESNIEKLRELRNLAILAKSRLQFGLTSLLVRLEYGDIEEQDLQHSDDEEELLLQ